MFPIQDNNPSRSVPFVNWLLILANVFMFLFEISMNTHELNRFVELYGVVPSRFVGHWSDPDEITTIFTSMFMHGGWFHLISNMWALFIFGDNIEDRLGHLKYLFFYLLCGVIAALTQIYLDPAQTAPTIGASGAIAGVLGAYLMLFPDALVITLIPLGFIAWFINVPAYLVLGVWFLTQAFTGWAVVHSAAAASSAGNIAFFAHVGGFISGFLLVRLLQKRDYRRWHKDEYYPW